MSDAVLSALMVAFILGCLASVITLCVVMMRRAQRQLARNEPRKTAAARPTSITADEIIDLHLALKDVRDLREISERVPA